VKLDAPVSANIDTGRLIYFNSGVPTLVDVDTANTNEIYLLAEKLVTRATEANKEGRKHTAVYFEIKPSDELSGEYIHDTETTADAPSVGDEVTVVDGVTVAKPGEGEVSRFVISEVINAYEDGSDTVTKVTLKRI